MEVDSLAKAAFADGIMKEQVKVQYIPSIDIPEVQQINGEANWTTLIVSYFKDNIIPKDKEDA